MDVRQGVGDTRQGWAILAAMLVLSLADVGVAYAAEAEGDPNLHALGVAGGNMEGKEVRFGIAASAFFAVVTSAASCGPINAMHDSFTAIGCAVPLLDIQLGEVVIGGVGAGLYGFLLFAILAIFVAGLMVGRSPGYVGFDLVRDGVCQRSFGNLAWVTGFFSHSVAKGRAGGGPDESLKRNAADNGGRG